MGGVSSLVSGAAGASHVDASWLAFCASASQGLAVVENHEFALLGVATSGAGTSTAAISAEESTGVGATSRGFALAGGGGGAISKVPGLASSSCFSGFAQASIRTASEGGLAFISSGRVLLRVASTAPAH